MDNKEKLGKFDQLYRQIEGETYNGEPVYAAAVFNADVQEETELSTQCLVASGSYNYSVTTEWLTKPSGYRGVYLVWDLFSHPASGTFLITLDIKNPCDSNSSAFAQMPYIYASGTADTSRRYLIYPTATDTDSLLTHITQLPIPKEWRLRANVAGGSGTWGYNLGLQYVE
jgi:hypothetical protein